MHASIRRLMFAVLLPLASSAWAAAPAVESAVASAADDARLQWGPCPPFMPAGCQIAVLHGDPTRPNVDVFFKVPGGAAIPGHWHSSPERMVLVAGTLEVTYEGEAKVTLRPGTYAYGPARKPHVGACLAGPPCVLFIAFESPLDAVPTEQAAQ